MESDTLEPLRNLFLHFVDKYTPIGVRKNNIQQACDTWQLLQKNSFWILYNILKCYIT